MPITVSCGMKFMGKKERMSKEEEEEEAREHWRRRRGMESARGESRGKQIGADRRTRTRRAFGGTAVIMVAIWLWSRCGLAERARPTPSPPESDVSDAARPNPGDQWRCWKNGLRRCWQDEEETEVLLGGAGRRGKSAVHTRTPCKEERAEEKELVRISGVRDKGRTEIGVTKEVQTRGHRSTKVIWKKRERSSRGCPGRQGKGKNGD